MSSHMARDRKREAELREAREGVEETMKLAAEANWSRKSASKARRARIARSSAAMQDELAQIAKELRLRRSARLKEYYDECYEQYERELRSMGLAFAKER